MQSDPVVTNPQFYRVIFENERVRVLEYLDRPGDETTPHRHPDSVMFTLTAFTRRLTTGGRSVDLELPEGVARWLPAQEHSGANIGETATHTIFVELKEPAPDPLTPGSPEPLGPDGSLSPVPD
ncbi:cupin domain-containing protein [Cryobacterium sp. Y29]|uniref:cupin domain-containing protein n=1 Tax=Cryobacterium sp. Y29 TaxID=2048285 RepID=UPI000CE49D5B|nr:cytoplasmic protein [Cryobacterium sp. Y29]